MWDLNIVQDNSDFHGCVFFLVLKSIKVLVNEITVISAASKNFWWVLEGQ